MTAEELHRLERRLRRERAARNEAEAIAERTLSELYGTVQDLNCSRALLDETTDFVAITEPDGRPTYLNRAFCELLGVDRRPPYDLNLLDQLTAVSRTRFELEALPTLLSKGVWRGEFAVRRPSGADLPVSQVLIAHRDATGQLMRISAISRDVSEQQELTDLLAFRAMHDTLTGLPNRRLLYDRLDLALARSVRTGGPLALLFMDLDGFKAINDTHGHTVGDQLLVAVTARLSSRLRSVDLLARVGGDEFVLLAESVGTESDAADIADRLIASVAEPVVLQGISLRVGMSVGVAVVFGGGVEPKALVEAADEAMYDAKRAGKGRSRLVRVPSG